MLVFTSGIKKNVMDLEMINVYKNNGHIPSGPIVVLRFKVSSSLTTSRRFMGIFRLKEFYN